MTKLKVSTFFSLFLNYLGDFYSFDHKTIRAVYVSTNQQEKSR
jgi:hypothetical protein